MQIEDLEMNTKILTILENYSQKWLENKNSKFMDLIVAKNDEEGNRLNWNSPENIESGLSGVAIFFIEAFKKTDNLKYLELSKNLINELIDYSQNNPTNNYALYTGRGGVVYAILQFYALNSDPALLIQAASIIKPATTTYLNSEFVNDSLYAGRAGTLLTICSLYELFPETSLLEAIRLFTRRIISNAQLSEDGLYWEDKEELHIKPPCGFAYGTAGIRYVFNRISKSISPEVLDYLNTKISLFESSCWVKEFGNWGNFTRDIKNANGFEKVRLMYNDNFDFNRPSDDYSWAAGTAGIGFSRVTVEDESIVNNIKVNGVGHILKLAIENDKIKKGNLFEGLAGIGCFFLFSQNEYHHTDSAIATAEKVLLNISARSKLYDGLIYGNLGSLYFLLLMIKPEKSEECVLCPLARPVHQIEIDPDNYISVANIRGECIEKYFPRIIHFLRELAPSIYNKFFHERYIAFHYNEIPFFVSFMNDFIKEIEGSSISRPLHDLFNLERSKYEFGISNAKNKIQQYIDDLVRHGEAIALINNSFDTFSSLFLIRSGSSKVISLEWDWSVFEQPMRKNHPFVNLYKQASTSETMFWISFDQRVVDTVLGKEETFIWHLFKRSTTIKKALTQLENYYHTMDNEYLQEQINETKSKNANDFWNKLQYMTVYKIKEWLYTGILKVDN